jgi:hypothetical protein
MTLLPFVFGFYFAGLVFFFARNESVYRFREKLIDRVSECSQKDISSGKDWAWRFKQLDTVTYDQMLWGFWKPLRAKEFYQDTSFLEV